MDNQAYNPYSYNMSGDVTEENFQLANNAYQNAQRMAAAGGVPISTSLDAKQRRNIQRQIISLYPDILNRNEADKVKL